MRSSRKACFFQLRESTVYPPVHYSATSAPPSGVLAEEYQNKCYFRVIRFKLIFFLVRIRIEGIMAKGFTEPVKDNEMHIY